MSWKRPIFALVTVLSFFALLEGALWLSGVETLLAERDPFAGFSKQVRLFELDEKRGIYRTPPRATRHSFNYSEFPADKPPETYRLFVLGGSSAYGFPWGARVAFPRLLGDALQAGWPERRVEAINVAGMSYGSHRLRILAGELLDYDPDALVIYSGHNEFIEQRFYREQIDRSVELDRARRWLYRWRLYSSVARLFESRDAPGDAATEPQQRDAAELLGLDVDREYPREVVDADKDEASRRFRENLEAILALARRARIPVVLCTVPSNTSRWHPNHSAFGAAVDAATRTAALALLDEGVRELDGGRGDLAIEILERARRSAPGHAEIVFRLGQAYESAGRFDEARDYYVMARDADARPSRAITSLNEAVRSIGERPGVVLVDVEHEFEKTSPHGLLGFDLFEDYVHPKPAGHRLIARLVWRELVERGFLGDPRPAEIAEFDAAVALDSAPGAEETARSPALLFNLAVVLENQGRIDDAMDNYRACLALHPAYYVARANLARLLSRQGRDEEAALEHRAVLASEPRYVRSMLGLGEALRRLGRLEPALQMFQRARRTDAASQAAWRLEGATLVQLLRLPEAEEALRRAVRIDPADVDARIDLGYCLLYQAKLDAADESFDSILNSDPGHRRGRNGRAAVLTERGQLEHAERLFRESLRLDPQDEFARVGIEEIARRRQGRTAADPVNPL